MHRYRTHTCGALRPADAGAEVRRLQRAQWLKSLCIKDWNR